MASLDGYSLNQKIDKLHSEIVNEINDMQLAFGQLYDYLQRMEANNKPVKKESKAKTKKEGAKNA